MTYQSNSTRHTTRPAMALHPRSQTCTIAANGTTYNNGSQQCQRLNALQLLPACDSVNVPYAVTHHAMVLAGSVIHVSPT